MLKSQRKYSRSLLSKLCNKRFTKHKRRSGLEEGRLLSRGNFIEVARGLVLSKLCKKFFTQ